MMLHMLRFRPVYFLLTVILLATEILIALFINDSIIRPYLGDILVVILMYCFILTFFKVPVNNGILLVLAIAVLVETLQYLKLINLLGLENSVFAKTVLGNTFSREDIAMYLLGGFIIWTLEKFLQKR